MMEAVMKGLNLSTDHYLRKSRAKSVLVLYITVKIGWVELTNSVNGRVGHDHFIQHELLLY